MLIKYFKSTNSWKVRLCSTLTGLIAVKLCFWQGFSLTVHEKKAQVGGHERGKALSVLSPTTTEP